MPPLPEVLCESIRGLSQQHLHKISMIFGTVVRTSNVNSRELTKQFECRQCQTRITCHSDISEFSSFVLPVRCGSPPEPKFDPFALLNVRLKKELNEPLGDPSHMPSDCKSKQFQPVDAQ